VLIAESTECRQQVGLTHPVQGRLVDFAQELGAQLEFASVEVADRRCHSVASLPEQLALLGTCSHSQNGAEARQVDAPHTVVVDQVEEGSLVPTLGADRNGAQRLIDQHVEFDSIVETLRCSVGHAPGLILQI